MFDHLVLFKWNEGAPSEAIAAAIGALNKLKDKIPGIVDLTCGENFSVRSQGFHCGLVVRFKDRASLEAYGPHPAHQEVVKRFLAPIRSEVIVVDYEIKP